MAKRKESRKKHLCNLITNLVVLSFGFVYRYFSVSAMLCLTVAVVCCDVEATDVWTIHVNVIMWVLFYILCCLVWILSVVFMFPALLILLFVELCGLSTSALGTIFITLSTIELPIFITVKLSWSAIQLCLTIIQQIKSLYNEMLKLILNIPAVFSRKRSELNVWDVHVFYINTMNLCS